MGKKLFKAGGLILICCIVLSGLAFADTNIPSNFKPGSEPDGFRGIKWGQDISTVEGLVHVSTEPSYGGIERYTREGDELKIGAAELDRIYYDFWQNKFCDVYICTEGYSNWSSFKAVVFEKFGEGQVGTNYFTYVWWGEKTQMLLIYNSGEGLLYMSSKEIGKQQEEWEKEQAKRGAEEGW